MNAMTSDTATEVLASAFTINKLLIKNRIILGPMAVLRPAQDGRPGEQSIAFLARRARGGVRLVIVTVSVVLSRPVRLQKGAYVPRLTRV